MHRFFEEEILPHYEKIYRYVLKTLNNKEMTEDVVQNTLEKAWKNLHRLKNPDSVKQWLFSIARNELYSALRRYGTLKEYEFAEELSPDIGADPEEDVLKLLMKEQEKRHVIEALKPAAGKAAHSDRTEILLGLQSEREFQRLREYGTVLSECISAEL